MSHNWIIEPVDLQNMQLLKESLHISELLASILIRRGIADPEEARYFCLPTGTACSRPIRSLA